MAKQFGMTDVLTFGKYRGRKVADVAATNAGYVLWCRKNIEWFNLTDDAYKECSRLYRKQESSKIARMEAWAWGLLPSQRLTDYSDLEGITKP